MNDIASKCVNKAISLYHKSQKEIIYNDRLSPRERALIHTDPEIQSMAVQIKDIEKKIVTRIKSIVQSDRSKSEAEKLKEAEQLIKSEAK